MALVPVDFPSELADGAVSLLLDRQDEFVSALGVDSDDDAFVEYARTGQERNFSGKFGRCAIYIEESQGFDPAFQYPDSALSSWSLIFRFDLIESRDVPRAKSRVMQAMQSMFGDGGTAFFGKVTDAGANRLGGSGRAVLGEMLEVPSEARGTANVRVDAIVEVSCWHKVPMVHEVEVP
jgi:hypothetical protein